MEKEKKRRDKLKLGWHTALWHAFFNREDRDFFPLRMEGQKSTTIQTSEILTEIYGALEGLKSIPNAPTPGSTATPEARTGQDKDALAKSKSAVDAILEHGRESLDEVKSLTEYTDQKSSRLLTVATLFVALAGLLLNNFVPGHPVRFIPGGEFDPGQIGRGAVYIFFALFVFSVVAGALVTFYANQTRFDIDLSARPTMIARRGPACSSSTSSQPAPRLGLRTLSAAKRTVPSTRPCPSITPKTTSRKVI